MGQPVFRRDSVDYLPVSYARFRIFDGVTAKKDRLGERIANLAIILVVFQFAYVVLRSSPTVNGRWACFSRSGFCGSCCL